MYYGSRKAGAMTSNTNLKTGMYRHNKTGNIYQVLGTALQTETNELMVVYKPVKNNVNHKHEYEMFVRPLEMFTEIVEINGEKMPRFEKIKSPRSFIV